MMSPKVSVCVVTYNQVHFIRQCLQSIVDQVTDFDFEVVVGDDCSFDGTAEIVTEFCDRYPDKVRALHQKVNIGAGVNNYLTVHALSRGEYIAHVDGDDYCLPGKLQALADLLDRDANCMIAFHRMLVASPDGELREGPLSGVRGLGDMRFDRGALIQFMAVGLHSAKMYRRSCGKVVLPQWDLIDYYINVEQVGSGYARYVGADCYGVYRERGGDATKERRWRRSILLCLQDFAKRYPSYRLQVNTAALVYWLADFRNGRGTWWAFFQVYCRTFHLGSLLNLCRSWWLVRRLRVRA